MSKALCCDNCGETLPLNSRGEHEGGEDSAWITVEIANHSYDLCTRSCLHEFIDSKEVVEAHNAWTETITGIATIVRDGREQREDDGDE